jgi:hypothetical protein
MADGPNPVAGGSGTGNNANVAQNNAPVQQNVVVNLAAQQAAAQLAQQILANTNVTLKQKIVKIPEFFGEKGKDTVTAQEFVTRIDECQVSNDWNDTTTFASFHLCLRGEADEWLSSTVRHLKLTAAQKTWTRIRPLFKKEFATTSDDKLIMDGLANPRQAGKAKTQGNFFQDWKRCSTSYTRTTPPTESSQSVQRQSNRKAPSPRML